MDGVAGYRAWRWIFILEGIATTLIGVLAFFIIPDWPETAKFLKPEERQLLLSSLQVDSGPAVMNRLDKKAMKRAFSDWKIYLG
jgi:MFS family permease